MTVSNSAITAAIAAYIAQRSARRAMSLASLAIERVSISRVLRLSSSLERNQDSAIFLLPSSTTHLSSRASAALTSGSPAFSSAEVNSLGSVDD